MILVDMNQVMISNLMIHLNSNELNEDMVRHMVLNSLRSYKTKFGDNYGELVLCYDDKHYWRKEYFPNYKANRKKDRSASKLDWNELFETLNKIRDEIKEVFPYKVLQVAGAEADARAREGRGSALLRSRVSYGQQEHRRGLPSEAQRGRGRSLGAQVGRGPGEAPLLKPTRSTDEPCK